MINIFYPLGLKTSGEDFIVAVWFKLFIPPLLPPKNVPLCAADANKNPPANKIISNVDRPNVPEEDEEPSPELELLTQF